MLASSLQRKYRGRFCFFKIAELVYINNIDIIFSKYAVSTAYKLHFGWIWFLSKKICMFQPLNLIILILRNSSVPAIAGCRLFTGYLAVPISDLFARPSGPLNSQSRRLCRRAQLAAAFAWQANSSSGGERYYSLTTWMRS